MTIVMFSLVAAAILTGLLALAIAKARQPKLRPLAARPRRPIARRLAAFLVALAVPALGAAVAYYSA
jgi:hypothetical protein